MIPLQYIEDLLEKHGMKYNPDVYRDYGYKAWILKPGDKFFIYDRDFKLLHEGAFNPTKKEIDKIYSSKFSDWLPIYKPHVDSFANGAPLIRPIDFSTLPIDVPKEVKNKIVIDGLYA